MEKQIAIGMMLPFIPVLIGETLFFYLILTETANVLTSFSVSLGTSAFGLMLWYMWRDRVRQEILEFEPINAMIFWSKEIVTWENQMITKRKEIKNVDILRPVTYDDENLPQFENPPTYKKEITVFSKKRGQNIRKVIELPYKPKKIEAGLSEYHIGNPEIVENMLAGWRAVEIHLHHASFAPNGIPYRKMQIIHNFPYSDDFYLCPNQFVVHQAQVLSGSSSVLSLTFLYWGERDEPIPVFHLGYSPAHADLTQISVGLKPKLEAGIDPQKMSQEIIEIVTNTPQSNDPEGVIKEMQEKIQDYIQEKIVELNEKPGKKLRMEIEEAVSLADQSLAMEYAGLLKNRTELLNTQFEHQRDSVSIAMALMNYWEENAQNIENLKGKIDLTDWRVIAGIVGGTILITITGWWLFFR